MTRDYNVALKNSYVNLENVVNVQVDDLVAYNEFLVALFVAAQDVHVAVADVKSEVPLDKELEVLWALLVEDNQE